MIVQISLANQLSKYDKILTSRFFSNVLHVSRQIEIFSKIYVQKFLSPSTSFKKSGTLPSKKEAALINLDKHTSKRNNV